MILFQLEVNKMLKQNAITKFDTDEFITNRSVIQDDLFFGVRQRLSGKCCLPGCKTKEGILNINCNIIKVF